MAFRVWRPAFPFATAVVFAAILFIAATTANDAAIPAAAGPLDGMVFVGQVGPEGKPDFDEELHFNNGYFWTKNCIRCAYQPGIYWVRKVGASIHFQGELQKENGSKFRYTGRIADGRARVTVLWSKDRWYWSIERTLIFIGKLAPTRASMTVDMARQSAETFAKQPMPQWCA
jgi:hypothetical protein